jgi:hypothetical protein
MIPGIAVLFALDDVVGSSWHERPFADGKTIQMEIPRGGQDAEDMRLTEARATSPFKFVNLEEPALAKLKEIESVLRQQVQAAIGIGSKGT